MGGAGIGDAGMGVDSTVLSSPDPASPENPVTVLESDDIEPGGRWFLAANIFGRPKNRGGVVSAMSVVSIAASIAASIVVHGILPDIEKWLGLETNPSHLLAIVQRGGAAV